MMTTNQPVWLPPESTRLACNCQYPIGLVIFLGFTILSLFVCICVCCFDITNCRLCRRKNNNFKVLHNSAFGPRLVDTSKLIDRKISLDPRLLEYSQLINNGSLSSSQSRSIEMSSGLYSTESSLVTTV